MDPEIDQILTMRWKIIRMDCFLVLHGGICSKMHYFPTLVTIEDFVSSISVIFMVPGVSERFERAEITVWPGTVAK